MSLIQQFLQENLTKDLNHQLLAQIQQQNSAVEILVSNLQGLRDKENLQCIKNKIRRIEQFMQLKKQVVTTLQPLNSNKSTVFQWVLNTLVDNSFLYELIKRQQFFVQKQLIEMGKQILLEDNYLQQHHEDTEFTMKIVRQMYAISQQKGQSTKNVNREKIKEIDYGIELIEQKIRAFEERVSNFNTQMMLFLRKIYAFDQKIRNDFYQHFKTEPFQPQTPLSNPSIKKGFTRQNSVKSHISLESQNRESEVKLIRSQQFYQSAQRTPRKFLQTQAVEPQQRPKPYQRKSVIEKKRLTLDDRRSTQMNEIKSSIHENRGSTIENKRVSMDYYKKGTRPSEKYEGSQLADELKSMNKTLSTLSYYNRPETANMNNMLYTTSGFGQQVRLPTKWASNSRSSLSYYPPR